MAVRLWPEAHVITEALPSVAAFQRPPGEYKLSCHKQAAISPLIQGLAQPWAQPASGNPERPSFCFICTTTTPAIPCLKVVGRRKLTPKGSSRPPPRLPPIPGDGETGSHDGWSTLKPSPDFSQTCRWGQKWPVLLTCDQSCPTSVCRDHQCRVRSQGSLPIYCPSCVPRQGNPRTTSALAGGKKVDVTGLLIYCVSCRWPAAESRTAALSRN